MKRPLFALVFASLLSLVACNDNDNNTNAAMLAAAADRHIAYGKSGSTQLEAAGSCTALEGELKAIAAAEIRTWFENRDVVSITDGVAGEDGMTAGPANYTNNQVNGVDEADVVKTDGKHLFVARGTKLYRLRIPVPGEIESAGDHALEGIGLALILEGTRLLVLSAEEYAYDPAAIEVGPARIKMTVLDWPDAQTSPTVVAERWFDGSYLTARLHSGTARIVLHGQLPNPVFETLWELEQEHESPEAALEAALEQLAALPLEDLLPKSYVRNSNGELAAEDYTENDCAAFHVPDDSNGGGVSSLVSFEMSSPGTINAVHVVSNWPTVYMSTEHLYLAESAQDWWWFSWNSESDEKLNLHAFALDGAQLNYLGSTRTEGAPINQFALDEHDGVLRVATWTGGWRWWWTDEAIESQLHTFSVGAAGLQSLASLRHIAPGEQLHAARFVGEKAYLVTFEQVDPLFVIDLADPTAPRILGELEVPGFSTYLHPLEGDRLLAVGVGGDENGVTWNTVVSLFDASDAAKPALVGQHDFSYEDGNWNWSESLYEHKAFQYNAERGLLAIPMSASYDSNGVWHWTSTLELVKVDGNMLAEGGTIDHSSYFSSHGEEVYGSLMRRSFFIGDFVYAISGKAVSVHATENPSVTLDDAVFTN